MSQELLYTSAPHGLKPGSRGFCTVLSTQGMAAPIASALEGLSGYRPVYPPGDERSDLNPVNWSHLTLQVAGRLCHVLSRVAEYGLDYSQRTNKLAHHVVLDPAELIMAGPAALLANPDFMRSDWDAEPHLVPAKLVPKIPPLPRGICQAWKDLTGDGGWAGVLAECFLRDPERPVILLYAPGQNMLPLIAEALSLIPADRRWELTFSTYFTGLPQGVDCTWRCMLSDSPEAHQSLRFVRALRLDLTAPDQLGTPSGGELVADARGVPRLKSALPNKPPALPVDRLPNRPGMSNDLPPVPVEYDIQADEAPPLPSGQVYATRQPIPIIPQRHPRDSQQSSEAEKFNQRRTIAIVVAGFGLVLLLLIGLGYSVVKSLRSSPPIPLAATPDTESPPLKPDVVKPKQAAEPKSKEPSKPDMVAEKKPKAQSSVNNSGDGTKVATAPSTTESIPNSAPSSPLTPESKHPADSQSDKPSDLQKGRKRIELDSQKKGNVTKLAELSAGALPVRELQLWAPAEVHLTLSESKTGKSKYVLTESGRNVELGTISWQAATPEIEATPLRTFALNFKAEAGSEILKRLNWCELNIEIEDSNDTPLIRAFHPFPIPRKTNEKRIENAIGKDPVWGVKWDLKIESEAIRLPRFSSDGITLSAGDQDYIFHLKNDNNDADNQQTYKYRSRELDQLVKESLSNGGEKQPAGETFAQLVMQVSTKKNDATSPVAITLTLEGLTKIANKLGELRRATEKELEQFDKELAIYNEKSARKNLDLPVVTQGSSQVQRVKLAIEEIKDVIKEISQPKNTEQSKRNSPKQNDLKQLEKYKIDFENFLKAEVSRSKIDAVLKDLNIKSVKLFYKISASSNGEHRVVYLFEDDGK